MKRGMYSMVTAAGMLSTISCSPDKAISTDEIANTVTSGGWHVTYFMHSNNDETNHFTGYNFTFGPNNVITATNGMNTHTGIWNVSIEDTSDDYPHLEDFDFDIIFNSPDNFTDLMKDWEMLERTSTKIRMKQVSGGGGNTDYLTFEKNL